MAGSKTSYLSQQILDQVLGGAAYTPAGTVYFVLSASPFDPNATAVDCDELTAADYHRLSKTNNLTTWSSATAAAPSTKHNNADLVWPTATSHWGPVSSVYVADAASGGNLLYGSDVDLPADITSGDAVTIPSATFLFNEYAAGSTSEIIEFSDFQYHGGTVGLEPFTSLIGSGVATTTYRMTAYTSTKAALVPTTVGTTTNPFTLLWFGGGDGAHIATGLTISDFTLEGTPQGMLYNGIMVGYSTGSIVQDLFIRGIPGNSNANPGETFSLNLWHANGVRVNRVSIDGINSSGVGVGASLFGLNNVHDAILTDCTAHHAIYGMGATNWKSGDVEYLRFDASHNRRAFNFENCYGGFIKLTDCDMRSVGRLPHVTINSNLGSCPTTITDPLVDAWPIKVGVSSFPYLGAPQTQRVSDVTLIVGGVDRTSDPAYLACGNVWP